MLLLYCNVLNMYTQFIIGRVDDRPITSPSLYFSYSPDPAVVNLFEYYTVALFK